MPMQPRGIHVDERDISRHLSRIELTGVSDNWLDRIEQIIREYVDAVNGCIDEDTTLEYLQRLQNEHDVGGYKKMFYQIRKFCVSMGADWASDLKAPKDRNNNDITIWRPADIRDAYDYLSNLYTRRYSAALLIGATSGIRAEELYNLDWDDIDLDERVIYVRKSKTGQRRIAFFNDEAAREMQAFLSEDIDEYKFVEREFMQPFNEYATRKFFRKTNVMPKHLRKFFSQEWDRHGGNTNIKKILMGHSLNGDIDLSHYAAHDVDDLRAEYERVDVRVFDD